MEKQMTPAIHAIEAIFNVKWFDAGRPTLTAGEVFEQSKAAAARALRRQAEHIEAVSFETYRAARLERSVQASSTFPVKESA
jgi:hypothetical protein